jgi:two-component system, NarL family, sensor kinase
MSKRPESRSDSSSRRSPETLGASLESRQLAHVIAENVMLRGLIDDADFGVATVSLDGEILYANSVFSEILQPSSAANVAGANLKDFVCNASLSAVESALRRAATGSTEGELKLGVKGFPSLRTIRLALSPIPVAGETHIRIVATDLTRLVEAESALANSRSSIRSLSARLLQVQDEERRRLARDLHDNTGQEIAFVVLSLDRIVKQLQKSDPDAAKTLGDSVTWVRKIESEIRTLSYLLHPPLLDEMGLASALGWFIDGFVKRTAIEVDLEVPEDLPRLPSAHEIALFRIVQEGLTNVFRHSGSLTARVCVSLVEDSIQLSIEDRGKGFNSIAAAASPTPGVGIQGMRGRLEQLGGHLDLVSGRDGSQVVATLPLQPREDGALAAMPAREPRAVSARLDSRDSQRNGTRKRILIADDHEIARRGIRTMLGEDQTLEVCGEASDGSEAVDKTIELCPDLLILDLTMPGQGGAWAAAQLRQRHSPTRILVYTTHASDRLEIAARGMGADGYVVKSNASEDLLRAVHAVLEGAKFFGGHIELGRPA